MLNAIAQDFEPSPIGEVFSLAGRLKAIGFSGGVDDYSTARVSISVVGGSPLIEVHSAAAECGQGIVTVMTQIARTELGVDDVVLLPADTAIGDAGSASASRQTWMTGGAVKGACELVRHRLLERAANRLGGSVDQYRMAHGEIVEVGAGSRIGLTELLGEDTVEEIHEFHAMYLLRRTRQDSLHSFNIDIVAICFPSSHQIDKSVMQRREKIGSQVFNLPPASQLSQNTYQSFLDEIISIDGIATKQNGIAAQSLDLFNKIAG